MDASRLLFAALLGLLLSCLVGYDAFPFGDDFAYAPLTEHRLDPSLYAKDDQLQLFENHAWVYEWVYRLGRDTVGVEPTFRVTLWVLAVASTIAIGVLLHGLGAPIAALPIVLGLSIVVQVDGMGRGNFGGLVSHFFHHQNVALTLVLGAIVAAFHRSIWLAGILLGLAAFAQPMTAFHGAIVVGLGTLLRSPRETVKLALAACIVAFPVALWLFGSISNGSGTPVTMDLIKDAYRFRAPAHYDPPWPDIVITTLYLLAGCAGTALLWRNKPEITRFAIGLLLGFGLLHLITLVVYKAAIAEWIGLFILDANRSTPLLFVVGASLAVAGIGSTKTGRGVWIAGIVLVTLLALNFTVGGLALIALGVAMIMAGDGLRIRLAALAGVAAVLLVLFPAQPRPPRLPASTQEALERIKAETDLDALFVIPASLSQFRQYTQRSAYVDFKLFSVAQPDQAFLTRERIEEVTQPAREHRAATGWPGIFFWDDAQNRRLTCATMADILAKTGAQYYVRRVRPDVTAQNCPGLPRPILTETIAVYGADE